MAMILNAKVCKCGAVLFDGDRCQDCDDQAADVSSWRRDLDDQNEGGVEGEDFEVDRDGNVRPIQN